MMLTQATANRLDIDNRRDPGESIDGGSRYLKILMDSLPERIQQPDRLWLALAAYNVGLGHLEDRKLEMIPIAGLMYGNIYLYLPAQSGTNKPVTVMHEVMNPSPTSIVYVAIMQY
jgi:soluble lytic murein transglycosylase-like protein